MESLVVITNRKSGRPRYVEEICPHCEAIVKVCLANGDCPECGEKLVACSICYLEGKCNGTCRFKMDEKLEEEVQLVLTV